MISSRAAMTNARRLHAILDEVDGLDPMRWDERVENHAHHLFMMRYDPDRFDGVSRERFVAALNAEGISCSHGLRLPSLPATAAERRFQPYYPLSRRRASM